MTQAMRNSAYWMGGPGNKRDIHRLDGLSAEGRQWASDWAARLYGSGRTVAKCWGEALDIIAAFEKGMVL